MTTFAKQVFSGHHGATDEGGSQRTLRGESWKKKREYRASSTAGGNQKQQHKTELDGVEWSVADVPLGVTMHKSSDVTRE